jgi:hypothetical protein
VKVVAALALLLLLAGCVLNEDIEFRILRERGEPDIVEVERVNLYSDATDAAGIREDFDRLVDEWRGTEALDEAARDGFATKGRELFVRDGKVVFRQTGIVQEPGSLFGEIGLRFEESQILWTVNGNVMVETNGRVVSTNPTTIAWPRNAPLLRVRIREPLSDTYKTTQPMFVKMLNDYMASQSK